MNIVVPNNNIYVDILDELDYQGYTDRWDICSDKIIIYGENACSLNQYIQKYGNLNYHTIIKLILNIGTQLAILAQKNLGILFFTGNDITFINDYFIITDLSQTSFLNDNKIKIIDVNNFEGLSDFIAPEIKNNCIIPFYPHISVAYYSFAMLCIYAFGSHNIEKIKHTKFDCFLKRCLYQTPEDRTFLYI